MNATATTTVTMIVQQPSFAESITAIMAFAALIVSGLTLWFTSLKGSNIVLRERPQFIQKTIQREIFDRFIPDTVVFETSLIFLNNGTASDVLRMDASFEPMKELAPFFKKDRFVFGTEFHRYTASASMPPISIDEKDSIVVYVELTVELQDWKEHFTHSPVAKEQIREVLCQADKVNKQRFSDFCAVLRNDMRVGRVRINSYQTTRRKIFGTKMAERVLVDEPIGGFNEELIGNFRSWERKWNNIKPNAILMETREIREFLQKELFESTERNFKMLQGIDQQRTLDVGQIRPLDTDLLDKVTGKFYGDECRAAITDFVVRSTFGDSRLKDYDLKTREWNRKFDLLREDPTNSKLEESIKADMDLLREESAHLWAETAQLLNTLQGCYMSNP